MANVFSLNNTYVSGNSNECLWRLTRVMKKAGWNTVACSNNTAKVAPATNNTDNWGNNADPLLDTYPAGFGAGGVVTPWIVMRGPSTLKIPITTAPTGTPIRGEKITQGAAEGELLGYVFDTGTSTGWMVVLPRTGTFTNSSAITGSLSSASFTPNGTIVTYVREFMFAKGNVSGDLNNHQIFYICADVAAENAQLYSSLAATAGATANIAPGCAATGTNAFPALGIVALGTAGTANPNTAKPFAQSPTTTGSYHVACANAIGATNVSPDGSFYLVGYFAAINTGHAGFGYTRIDDGDPGDCDPYAVLVTSGSAINSWVRTSTQNGVNTFAWYGASIYAAAVTFVGYQARGCPIAARDVATFYNGVYYNPQTMTTGFPTSLRTLNHPATTPPLVRENIVLWCAGQTLSATPLFLAKQYKGKARWICQTGTGNNFDTFDSKKFICTSTASASVPAIMVGPWDGSTTPNST